MRKLPLRLLAKEEAYPSFFVLFILSTLAHNPNIQAAVFGEAPQKLIDLGTCIREKNGEGCGTDEAPSLIYQRFGFDSDAEMREYIAAKYGEHESVKANIAAQEATLENLALLPDNFIGKNGATKKLKASETKKQSGMGSGSETGSPGLIASMPSPIKVKSLAQPTAVAEGSLNASSGCGGSTGLSCEEKAEIVNSVFSDTEKYSALASGANTEAKNIPLGRSKNSPPPLFAGNINVGNYGSGTFGGGHTNGAFSASAMTGTPARSPFLDNRTEGKTANTNAINEFLNLDLKDFTANPQEFKEMPVGWTPSSDKPEEVAIKLHDPVTSQPKVQKTELQMRGNMEKEFDSSNPENPDNFVQVVITKKVGNLPPGIYMIPKTDITKILASQTCSLNGQCTAMDPIAAAYKNYNDQMAHYLSLTPAERLENNIQEPKNPVFLDIQAQIALAANDPVLASKLINTQNQENLKRMLASGLEERAQNTDLQIDKPKPTQREVIAGMNEEQRKELRGTFRKRDSEFHNRLEGRKKTAGYKTQQQKPSKPVDNSTGVKEDSANNNKPEIILGQITPPSKL